MFGTAIIYFSQFCPIFNIVSLLTDAGEIALGLDVLSNHKNYIISQLEAPFN